MTKNSTHRKSGDTTNGQKKAALIAAACLEAKGRDVAVMDVSGVFSLSDYFVIVSARSDRQVQGITNKILTSLEKNHFRPNAVEGMEKAHWVLVDFDEVIVHVFYEPMRSYYDLESLWVSARKLDLEKDLGAVGINLEAA